MLGHFWLVVSEDMSTEEAPAPESTLPWRWWELLGMWWKLLLASYIPEEKTGVLKTSLFWKLSLAQEYVAELEVETYPGFETGLGSGEHVIDPVRTYLTRYSLV